MKKLIVISSFVVAAAGSLSGQGMPPHAPVQSVSVTGSSRMMLAPDRVTFTVGVETQSKTAEQAVTENNRRTAAVIAALKKAGAKAEEIQTTNFSIFPQQEYLEGQRPRIIGYQASNNVTVTRNETSDAGKLLQASVEAGVNTASGLSLSVSDRTRGRADGLKKAFEDARAKADVLARAAGRSVGQALSIVEGSPMMPPVRPMGGPEMAMMKSANVPVEAGTDEVMFEVSVMFELR